MKSLGQGVWVFRSRSRTPVDPKNAANRYLRPVAKELGLNSFSVFLDDTRSDFQRAKSREFSRTSVAPVRIASDAISRSRKRLTKSICPKVLRERRSRMPVSIQAEPGGAKSSGPGHCGPGIVDPGLAFPVGCVYQRRVRRPPQRSK